MNVALILTETSPDRNSHFLALEMDERLERWGMQSKIIDLADPSYQVKGLAEFDGYLLIGSNKGPLYSNETHRIIANNRQIWRSKRVGSVMVATEKVFGDAADIQLKLVLKTLGANLLPDQLVVTNPGNKFDQSFNLIDHSLNSKIDQFLYLFAFGSKINTSEKLIA